MEIKINLPGKKIPSELYHYCSCESFYNIIESKRLWLSSSKYTHDPDENQIVKQILLTRIDNEIGDFKESLEQLIVEYEKEEGYLTPFIFCFSEEVDDLYQWRYYANDGKGFMIGFNTNHLPRQLIWDYIFSENKEKRPNLDDFYIGQVIYNPKEQNDLINQLIDIFRLSFKLVNRDHYQSYARMLHLISSMFKDQHYYKENEWRLIRYPNINERDDYSFRKTDKAIIPITTWDLALDSKETDIFLKSVLIGPCNRSENRVIDRFGHKHFQYWRFNSTQKSDVKYLGK